MTRLQTNKYCLPKLIFSLFLLIAPYCHGAITAYYKIRWHSVQLFAYPNGDINHSYQSGELPCDMLWKLLRLKEVQNFLQSRNKPDYWVLASGNPDIIHRIDLHVAQGAGYEWFQTNASVPVFFDQNNYALRELKGALVPEQSTLTTRQGETFDWYNPKTIQSIDDDISFLVLEFIKQSPRGYSTERNNQGILINQGIMQEAPQPPWFFLTDWLFPAYTVDIEQYWLSTTEPVTSEVETIGNQQEELLVQISLENGEETNCIIPRSFLEHMSRSDRINPDYWVAIFSGQMRVSAGDTASMNSLCQQVRQGMPQAVRQLASLVESTISNLQMTQEIHEQNACLPVSGRATIVVPGGEKTTPSSQRKEQTGSSVVAQESSAGAPQSSQLSMAKVNLHQPRVNEPEKEKHETASANTPVLLPVKPDVVIHQAHKSGNLLHLPLGKGSVVQTISHSVILHMEPEHGHLNLITPLGGGHSITRMATSGHKSEPFHFRTENCHELEGWLPTRGALFMIDHMSGIGCLKVTVIAEEGQKAELFQIREKELVAHKERLQPENRTGNRQEYCISVFSELLQLQLKNGQLCIEETSAVDYMGQSFPVIQPVGTQALPEEIPGNLVMIYDRAISYSDGGFLQQELTSEELLPPRVEIIGSDEKLDLQSEDIAALSSVNACYCSALEYLEAHGGNTHIALAHGRNPFSVNPSGAKAQLRLLCQHVDRMERYSEASAFKRQHSPEFLKFARTPHACEFKPFLEEGENIAIGISESGVTSPSCFVCYHPAESDSFLNWDLIAPNTLSCPREGALVFSTKTLDIRKCYKQLSVDELNRNCRVFTGGNGYVYRSTVGKCPVVVKKTSFRHRELEFWSYIKHENIVPLTAAFFGTQNPQKNNRWMIYYVMPVMNVSLDKASRQLGPLLPKICSDIPGGQTDILQSNTGHCIIDICQALLYLHSRGFAHRDIKSSNVLIQLAPGCNCPSALQCQCATSPKALLADFDALIYLSSDGRLPASSGLTAMRREFHPGTQDFRCPELNNEAYISNAAYICPINSLDYIDPESRELLHTTYEDATPDIRTRFHQAGDYYALGVVVQRLFIHWVKKEKATTFLYHMHQVEAQLADPASAALKIQHKELVKQWDKAGSSQTDTAQKALAFVMACLHFNPLQRPSSNTLADQDFIQLMLQWAGIERQFTDTEEIDTDKEAGVATPVNDDEMELDTIKEEGSLRSQEHQVP